MRYSHITISGGVCSGKGTLARNLKPYLESEGWTFFSGSEFAHAFAPQFYNEKIVSNKHHHTAQDYSDEVDQQIDSKMREILQTDKHHVIDAWLAGYNARGISSVLKVLLICSHSDVIIDRIANRDNCTVEKAKEHLKSRETTNLTKWTRMYGDYGFLDPKNFDLVIDTYSSGPMETVGRVLDRLQMVKAK
ncbi:MAG: cytidylate kinase family protein [Candidatus Roizmanbacteria bacterium]